MSRYIVIHKADYEKLGSFEHMIDIAQDVAKSLDIGVAWKNSWWSSEDEVLICEWEAPDRPTMDHVLERVCEYWPVDKIYEVLWSDPRWYSAES